MVKKNRIEELLKQAETTSNVALKNALTQHAEEEQKKEEKELLKNFKTASGILSCKVDDLVNIRSTERRVKAQVTAVDTAFEKFKTDGDFVAFREACTKAGIHISY